MAYSFSNFFKSIGSAFKPPATPLYNPLKPKTTVPPAQGSMSIASPQQMQSILGNASQIPMSGSSLLATTPLPTFGGPSPIPQVTAPTPTPPAITPTLTPKPPAVAPTISQADASAMTGITPPGTAPGAPAVPATTPETQAAYDAASKAYEKSLKLTPDELATQGDIDKLVESTRTAYRNTQDQPIPMEFITGQLASIERRALGLAEPLERKLARLQAARTSSLEASKFKLEQTGKQLTEERTAAQTARTEAESARRFEIEQAGKVKVPEPFTLGEGQVRYDAEGNVIASNVGSEGLSGGFGGGGYQPGENSTVDAWVTSINNGKAKISDIKNDKLRNAVVNGLSAGGSTTDKARIETLQNKISTIDDLMKHRGMSKSVGPSGIARWTPFTVDTWTGEVQDFVAGVHQLTSKETLDFLINIKSQGGTFGALSEKELDILKGSATKINDWEIKNSKGNPTGKWNISESLFKVEMAKIQEVALRALERSSGGAGGVSEEAEPGSEYEKYLQSIQ